MSKRDPLLLIDDMLTACQRVEEYTQGMDFDSFVVDFKTIDAVSRNLEIIGEAARRLP